MDRREVAGAAATELLPKNPRITMTPLPPSSKIVLEILGTEGAMTHKDIVEKSHFRPRTVRYALKKLKENNLLVVKMNLHDMRQIIYQYRMSSLQENGLADR
ncbi:MAG: helix-turn-helix domain-containing protein [Methanoregula sp.]